MDQPITILLVDDEPLVSGIICKVLERDGHAVVVAQDGAEGLRVFDCRREEIDLVIADIQMPDMTGLEMALTMRRKRRETCVLFISGENDLLPDWVDETCGLLRKPFPPAELLAAVEECLQAKCNAGKTTPR